MRLLASITPHGFGHATQTAVVVNALQQQLPSLDVLVQTTVPRTLVDSYILRPYTYIGRSSDFGLHMRSSLHIDFERSAAAYRDLHRNWDEQVEREAAWLESRQPDAVLSNVSYLTLAGARAAGIPAVAMCSLNWATIYRHYFSHLPEADGVHQQMVDAYNSADHFLCPQPSMAMPELDNAVGIGCLARTGRQRRSELDDRLNATEASRVVLVSFGGNASDALFKPWPERAGVHWIVPDDWADARRPDVHGFAALGMPFVDVLRSSDALLGKCGYGTVSECACNETPLVYYPRPEWPEEQALLEWLVVNGRCEPLARDAAGAVSLQVALDRCWSVSPAPAPEPDGAGQAARVIRELLSRSRPR